MHISRVNCAEMAGHGLRKLAYEIFSIKHKFWQPTSRPHNFKKACSRDRQREIHLKIVISYRYWLI